MLTISTIPEALAELDKRTGRTWTDSELFDVATRYGIELHAAPPTGAKTTIEKYIDGVGLVETIPRLPRDFDYLLAPYVNTNHPARLAVLFPAQIEQLWLSGEVFTRHSHLHNEVEDETIVFFEAVRVTREQVRIKAATLQKILGVWDKAQAGQGKRYKGPEWMFITQQPAPATDTAKPASDGPTKRSNRKPSWATVAMPYMKSLFTAGHYKSAAVFYKALMSRAGESDSPFKLVNRELYCTEAGTTVSNGALGNVWPEIRAH